MRDFIYRVIIPPQAIDMHGHMNNVYYFTLMQEAAFAHSAAVGDTVEAQYKRGEIWLIRKNEAKYIKSAKLMDEIEIYTYTQTEGNWQDRVCLYRSKDKPPKSYPSADHRALLVITLVANALYHGAFYIFSDA